MPPDIQCHSRWLCYVKPYENKVEMLNLETGETKSWPTSEEWHLYQFAVSDRYLVVASNESYVTRADIFTLSAVI